MNGRTPLLLTLLSLLLVVSPRTTTAAPRDVVGPLVGHVTAATATVWAYSPARTPLVIHFRPKGAALDQARSAPFSTETSGRRMARVKLTGLSADTEYVYRVRRGRESHESWTGRFRTAPPEGRPTYFTMAVASCMKPTGSQQAWNVLMGQGASFQLLLGDNVYADTTSHERLWRAHIKQRRSEPFATVIRTLPTYAVWDDHDFASNDSDGTTPGKINSLRAFEEVWPNPGFGKPGALGTFFKFSWGDVDFFVLDGRYYRSPNKARDNERKRMLGDKQFRWLVDGLAQSTAKFKVIASGSTLKEKDDDSWAPFTFARRRIFEAIARRRIDGVLWMSGDLHRSLVRKHPKSETGFYDLYEIVSSGIAGRGVGSFATLTFNTRRTDPTVTITVLGEDAQVQQEQRLRLSQLTLPR